MTVRFSATPGRRTGISRRDPTRLGISPEAQIACRPFSQADTSTPRARRQPVGTGRLQAIDGGLVDESVRTPSRAREHVWSRSFGVARAPSAHVALGSRVFGGGRSSSGASGSADRFAPGNGRLRSGYARRAGTFVGGRQRRPARGGHAGSADARHERDPALTRDEG